MNSSQSVSGIDMAFFSILWYAREYTTPNKNLDIYLREDGQQH